MMEYTLCQQGRKLTVDERGRLTVLDRGNGNVIADPGYLFRAVVKDGSDWEAVVDGVSQTPVVTKTEQGIDIFYKNLKTSLRESAITVILHIALDGERFHFSADVENHESSCMLTDFLFPCVGALRHGDADLLWPDSTGQRLPDIMRQDRVVTGTYPGLLSMQWMALLSGNDVLYLAGHDAKFHASIYRAIVQQGMLSFEFDRLAFVKAGETWKCPETVLWLYQGSWRRGADEYRAWCSTWRIQRERSRWIEQMNGYFLVIHKQQYGDELWPYGTLPSLYAYAKQHGCDTVGMFGWYDSGHDNQYPDLQVSESLGGAEALRENIKKVQAEGGHVTLYYQGHLMDPASAYYQKTGWKLAGRTIWGTPYYEDYSKSDASPFLQAFSKKKFATVCPSCTEWHDLMAQKADWIASFGPDGVLYDQIGGMPPYPCFNEEHHHAEGRPSLSYTQGRIRLLRRIKDQVKSHGSEFAFMTEHETDVYSQFPDALHGIGTSPEEKGESSKGNDKLSMKHSTAPYLFRYCFPAVILTLRNPHPFLSTRYVNYALLYGFRFELEIRYASDKLALESNAHPEWCAYARKIAAVRKKHQAILLSGTYRDHEGYELDNPSLLSSMFVGESGKAIIVLWNDSEEEQAVRLSAEGIVGCEDENGPLAALPASLASGKVLLVLLDGKKCQKQRSLSPKLQIDA